MICDYGVIRTDGKVSLMSNMTTNGAQMSLLIVMHTCTTSYPGTGLVRAILDPSEHLASIMCIDLFSTNIKKFVSG